MYNLAPSPDLATKEEQWATWNDGFSESEITNIIGYGEALAKAQATVGAGAINPNVRRSSVSWIGCDNQTQWMYDRLGWIVRNINGQFYNFDLYGFEEAFQYTIYHGRQETEGDYYGWHMDKGNLNCMPRKLSLVIQLSNPDEYEGGDLELMTANSVIQMEKRKGLIVSFPSWILHRVTPVIKGTRRSLVIWTGGPAFR